MQDPQLQRPPGRGPPPPRRPQGDALLPLPSLHLAAPQGRVGRGVPRGAGLGMASIVVDVFDKKYVFRPPEQSGETAPNMKGGARDHSWRWLQYFYFSKELTPKSQIFFKTNLFRRTTPPTTTPPSEPPPRCRQCQFRIKRTIKLSQQVKSTNK